jgi:hypothetical protein
LEHTNEGGSDAHSGFGDFDDRDGFDGGTGSGPDIRSIHISRARKSLRVIVDIAASTKVVWRRSPAAILKISSG